MKKLLISLVSISALASLLGCGEQPQTITAKPGTSAAKADDLPYGAGKPFADRNAWQLQLRARADNQNEYKRFN
ncbi:MAG: hypothetical protein ABIZ64_08640 [Casimicrobium sp.]|jgi:hypothetical protein